MVRDNFDKLAEGKAFDSRSSGSVVDGTFIMAKVFFKTDTLKYVVRFSYGSDHTEEDYEHKRKALERYEELCDEHGLD